MEDWKMSQLKAHQQFTLGRIDGLRWVLERIDILNDEDYAIEKQEVRDRISEHEGTDRELQRLIQVILDKRENEKQERLGGLLKTHQEYGMDTN